MSYREFIPEPIKAAVASWNLSAALLRALWESAKNELRNRPEHDFRRVVAPIRCLILPLSVDDFETGETRNFVFYVDLWVKPGERTVIEVIDLDKPIGTISPHSDTGGICPRPEFT